MTKKTKRAKRKALPPVRTQVVTIPGEGEIGTWFHIPGFGFGVGGFIPKYDKKPE